MHEGTWSHPIQCVNLQFRHSNRSYSLIIVNVLEEQLQTLALARVTFGTTTFPRELLSFRVLMALIFFRIPSCLEQLLPSYKYLVVTILFLISYFLKINTFSAHLLFRRSFFSRISNYSEYVFFRSSAYSE